MTCLPRGKVRIVLLCSWCYLLLSYINILLKMTDDQLFRSTTQDVAVTRHYIQRLSAGMQYALCSMLSTPWLNMLFETSRRDGYTH